MGIMLVYDVTNEKSFENIRNWIRNIEEVSVSVSVMERLYTSNSCTSTFAATVEPPNKGHLGTRASVLYSEVSFIRRLEMC